MSTHGSTRCCAGSGVHFAAGRSSARVLLYAVPPWRFSRTARTHMAQEESNIVLIAMELGSRWPEWMETSLECAPNRVIMAQDPDEGASDFAARVVRRIGRIAAAGQRIVAAVVAAGRSFGGAWTAARCRIVQALARVTNPLHTAQIFFSVDERSSDGVRHDTLGLACALDTELANMGVRVALAEARSADRGAAGAEYCLEPGDLRGPRAVEHLHGAAAFDARAIGIVVGNRFVDDLSLKDVTVGRSL